MFLAHIRTNLSRSFLPRVPEWIAAGTTVLLGFLLSKNPELMASTTSKGYKIMLSIADQATWAWVFYLVGLARVIVLIINGAWRRSPLIRAGAAFMTCFLWSQAMLSFYPTQGFAYAFSWGFLVMEITNAYRAMRDLREVDDLLSQKSGIASHHGK